VGLGVVADLKAHPLRRLVEAGVNCTVSTDDPLSFGNTLHEEYALLAREAGYTRPELARLAKNGWSVADVPSSVRAAMAAQIDRALTL